MTLLPRASSLIAMSATLIRRLVSLFSGRAVKLGIGGGLAAAAGGLYGVAFLSAQQARKASDVDSIRSASSRANFLVLTSALLGAASVGVSTWALTTDGRSIRLKVRF